MRISEGMNDYAYQIKGALEDATGKFQGFHVMVCNANRLELVNVPVSVWDRETISYVQFRMGLTKIPMNIQRLPIRVQNKIRVPLGKWLDQWVLRNFYGDITNNTDTNT